MISSRSRPSAAGPGEPLGSRMRELRSEEHPLVRDQHVVSRVLLKEFSTLDQNGGHQLLRYNLEFDSLKELGVGGCGVIKNWMPVASRSIEEVWGKVENSLPKALSAVRDGSLLNSNSLSEVIKNTVALHYVRSPHIRSLAHGASGQSLSELGREVIDEFTHVFA